jgi:hypothetical protein
VIDFYEIKIHTETRPGLIGELLAYEASNGSVWFSIYLFKREDGKREDSKWLDFIELYKLPDAVAALSAGMKGGNFDRYRAEERHRFAVENDALDQY